MSTQTIQAANFTIHTQTCDESGSSCEAKYTAELAIVLHRNKAKDEIVVTAHDIQNDRLQVGKMVSIEDLAEVIEQHRVDISTLENNDSSYIPLTVLVDSSKVISFYKPSHLGRLWQGQLEKKAFNFNYPAMLYVVNKHNRKLSVFALAYNRRPKLSDRVYAVPLPNIYSSGIVCQGTAVLPQLLSISNIDAIVDSFIGGVKTHLNCNDIFRPKFSERNTQNGYQRWLKQNQSNKVRVSELVCRGTVEKVLIQSC
ncbi:hypothetical protein UA38_11670 [Photobacterium kishitanii]|uniref:PRTRC system protein B n=1 Tax=Photobacterium kishitanii TaxID=318456 RepID=A0AAX0YV76_9GAMM|nr:hypothetical protein [Photobacterium kishitanii]KJG57028.1 hypothetical protein UA38_11670 [Photobacterium kishitanii]KJG60552.1 hypothetical protein UA42_14455 [Photobacterium kishitanii]KJG64854.1 hypothetical protein UA40_14150 [Photobacterium kishitanii]KJG68490.1 hypothetical protein UA41_16560 [Photobacterium kishitanii]OBU31227.1 hypothetical protein AYY23_20150 [Photobacterium kishitanii]